MRQIKLRPYTQDHDIDIKVKKIKEFLTKQEPVRVIVVRRGREMRRADDAHATLRKVLDKLAGAFNNKSKINDTGRTVTVTLNVGGRSARINKAIQTRVKVPARRETGEQRSTGYSPGKSVDSGKNRRRKSKRIVGSGS